MRMDLDLPQLPTVAYVDGANLHRGVESQEWKLDYRKFRSWIRQKYLVTEAYIFLGLVPRNADLYSSLRSAGYKLVFKEVVYDGAGKPKGNCDADLVLQAMKDHYEKGITSAVLVSSDGDYASLVRFWQERDVRCTVVSPARLRNAPCSSRRLAHR
jgi:uncharacterized LabA/DUF88 family protein